MACSVCAVIRGWRLLDGPATAASRRSQAGGCSWPESESVRLAQARGGRSEGAHRALVGVGRRRRSIVVSHARCSGGCLLLLVVLQASLLLGLQLAGSARRSAFCSCRCLSGGAVVRLQKQLKPQPFGPARINQQSTGQGRPCPCVCATVGRQLRSKMLTTGVPFIVPRLASVARGGRTQGTTSTISVCVAV